MISNFKGGLPASFKWKSTDRGVVRDRSAKWTDWDNKVSSLNHKQVPATSLAETMSERQCYVINNVFARCNSYISRFEMTARSNRFSSLKFDFKTTLEEKNTSPFVFEAIFHCVKWCHGIYDHWLSPQFLARMISLGKHSSRKFTHQARIADNCGLFTEKQVVLVNTKVETKAGSIFRILPSWTMSDVQSSSPSMGMDFAWNERSIVLASVRHLTSLTQKYFTLDVGWQDKW